MIQRNWSVFFPWLTFVEFTVINGAAAIWAQEVRSVSVPQSFEEAKLVRNVQASVVSVQTFVSESRQEYCRVGSGFIYDEDGYIVTRGSVIQGCDSIFVTLADGRRGSAWVVHHDEAFEVALLKIPFGDLDPIPMGKSSKLVTKSQVTVLGNSLGVFPSVSLGTYLGKRADGMLRLGIMVPPGNSGSPVLDDHGRLVGILAGRVLDDNSSEERAGKMCIALPVERVRQVVEGVFYNRHKEEGWIGISAINLKKDDFGKGVRVVNVVPGGPAERAGFCIGDTIVSFQGRSVRYTEELAKWVSQSPPKQSVEFTVSKGGSAISRTVRVNMKPWFKKRDEGKRR